MKSLDCIGKDRSVNVALHPAETWTLNKADMKRIAAFEITCYRSPENAKCPIWRQHGSNSSVLKEVKEQSQLLRIVKCRKVRYFGHVVRAHSAQNLCSSILHGHIDGTRPRGRPSRRWTDDLPGVQISKINKSWIKCVLGCEL